MAADDPHARRAAAVLLLVGTGLVLIGLALLLQQEYVELALDEASLHAQAPAGGPEAAPGPLLPEARRQGRLLRQVLFLTLILVLVFAVSTLAFLRWSRKYRRSLLRKPRGPTPSSDVWAMHRLAPEGDAGPPATPRPEGDEPPGRGV